MEVTSSGKLADCKLVLDTLLSEMVALQGGAAEGGAGQGSGGGGRAQGDLPFKN